ncbi:TrbI/VirB10 family protein [Dongia sedimenti]|uniref:TrbI/VirB10 family protein n=1 Tax=Dongia sedimenti TaxID=3064282 RepID=A0ABU0YTP9_9PROT|nr:TrbI/VirB10 family protein [Rhodospirillaceae bacterium R-7]
MAGEKPTTAKVDPETLALRAAPRRVVRFKRRLMIGIAAVGIAGIFGVTWLALKGPILRFGQQAQELYSTDRNSTAEGLDGLPKDYGEMKPETPVLGPPLPGDLGPPILERQKQLGLAPGVPESEADREAEAERQRLAQLARAAREASVFFQVTIRSSVAVSQGSGQTHQAESADSQFNPPVGNRLSLDPDHDPNNQQRKLDFLNDKSAAGIYNPHVLQDPASPYQVMAGTVIEAALVTGLNSDLPGEVIAQTTSNTFDSVSGQTLLVPQGSRLIGSYDSVIAFGQSRALVVWRRIIFPDGSSIEIDNLPATDAAGYAGLEDEVDFHTWRVIKGIALATLLGVGTELSLGDGQSDLVRALQQSGQQSTNAAGQRLVEKNFNIQPTITVRPGWPLRVIVEKDLVLRPYRG